MGTGAARADDGPVLVIGATGHQGGAVARQLLDTERRVRALVRDPGTAAATALQAAGAELAVGDLDEPDTVKAALDGVAGVFLALTMMTGPRITAEGVVTEQRHGTSVVYLAKQAGVGHLVYSSISGANTGTGIPYYESKARIEERIRALGVPATILRPVTFMDNFATYNKPAIRDGELVVSLAVRPDRPMALIAVRDIGAFAVLSFTHPDEFIGRAIDIAGDALTPQQIAETFGRVSGIPTRYHRTPIAQIRTVDEQLAQMFAHFDDHPTPPPDLAVLRSHHPRLLRLEPWLRATGWRP
jgi:uncharacterized protein YbjT (DUF2867 family)